MFKIQTLNDISLSGLELLPHDQYEIASDLPDPDAMLLRSHNMHEMVMPESLQAVARAGAGVNNIPIDRFSAIGVPVFNTPGANANAVKELVIAGMLIASRNICSGWEYVQHLKDEKERAVIAELVEKKKKQFAGTEIAGKTLGVIGMGAIGVKVANAALSLGMQVIGFDPGMTVEHAWELSSGTQKAATLEEVLLKSDYLTLHVPLSEKTKGLLNQVRVRMLKKGIVVLNFSRFGVIDEKALFGAVEEGVVRAYVTDFPNAELPFHPGIICLPHLGASTEEAEDNCARMAVTQLRDYLEKGDIKNSVNFPEVELPSSRSFRIAIANANVPNMVGQISSCLGDAGLNIVDLLNRSRGDVAYTLLDVDKAVPDEILATLKGIEGILRVRCIGCQ